MSALPPSPIMLPQELLDKIIDNLHHDFKSLKSCSLASSLLKLRSHKYLYSTIRLPDMNRIQRLRGLVNLNSMLLENVRKLELEPRWSWIKEDTDLPCILRRATSLRSLIILGETCIWTRIHRNTQDALIQAFRSSSLVNLSIHGIYFIPIPIFALDINVTYLVLREIMFDASTDDFHNVTSADYSRMTVTTLEISFSNASLVHIVVKLPNSFITRIRHLIICDAGMTASLTHRIMTAARNSLESLRIQQTAKPFLEGMYHFITEYIEHLLKIPLRLVPPRFHSAAQTHIAFYLELRFGVTSDFELLATTALARVVDFLILNPTAARIQNLSICIIRPWEGHSIPDWGTFLHNFAAISHWAELDRILDLARGSVSLLSKHIVSLDLGLTPQDRLRYLYGPLNDFAWRQSIDEMQILWRDKIHNMMPLASHRTSGKGLCCGAPYASHIHQKLRITKGEYAHPICLLFFSTFHEAYCFIKDSLPPNFGYALTTYAVPAPPDADM
ncbi:hypothetical protein Hypma_002005 [Hypsizygus marmoreus]|uniref:Uncharacterized protein n=1 Tax=Hypsizygus marmoreus TaxID=39966 RepID=A0A369J583_HYPMA|nr:hypothetical protein Hypma_002005 [Hypsizygus marmoreus]